MGAFLFEASFFFSSQRRMPGLNELAHTMAGVQECVCVCLLLCKQCMFHYQTLSSVLNGNFLFFLLVWTRETISRQSRVYCFCFCPLVGLESSAFSAGVGIVPSSGAGYAARRVSWK